MTNIRRFPWILIAALVVASWGAACDSGSGGATDVSTDVPADVPTDVPTDVTPDTPADVPADVPTDVPAEVSVDLPGDPGIDVPPLPPQAKIRFIHLSEDTPPVDFFLNDAEPALVTYLQYNSSTIYRELDPGAYNIDMALATGGLAYSLVDTGKWSLEAGTPRTAWVYDAYAAVKIGILSDDYAGLASGTIRIQAVHAATGLGPITLSHLPADGAPVPLLHDVDIGTASGPLDLAAGSFRLGVDLNNDGTPDTTFTVTELEAGDVADVFLMKSYGRLTLKILPQVGMYQVEADYVAPTTARVRLVHLSDSFSLDVFADNTEPALFQDMGPSTGTPYAEFAPGPHNFDVAPDGLGLAGSGLDTGQIDLTVGTSYTVMLYNVYSALQTQVLVDDNSDLDASKVRLRFVHAANGYSHLDFYNLVSFGPFSPLCSSEFGMADATADLPTDGFLLGIDEQNSSKPHFAFLLPPMQGGTVVNLFAVKLNGEFYVIAQMPDGTYSRLDKMAPGTW
jgi:hypothetical protein